MNVCHVWCDYVSASVFQMIDALAWERWEYAWTRKDGRWKQKREEVSASRFPFFLSMYVCVCWCFSSSVCVWCVCDGVVCVRVSNILCDGESSLYKRRYRPGIVCMFFRSHISHTPHTAPPDLCARAAPHHQRPPPLSELFKHISISIATARIQIIYPMYTIIYLFIL